MAVVSAARIRSKQIGDALATLIKANAGSLSLKVAQFGAIELIADPSLVSALIPGVFIKSETTTITPGAASFRMYDVTDTFRICYGFDASSNVLELPDKLSDDVNTIVRALAQDVKLSAVADFGTDQIVESRPLDVLWINEEDVFFLENKIPVRVVVLRWDVKWMARDTT